MPRAVVTPELSTTIHNLRVENRIMAKDLAARIGKSRAFVSRLENGSLATIDSNVLADIFRYILNESPDSTAFLNKIYDALEFKYSNKEIEDQLWFYNFDTVRRQIPIPAGLIDELNEQIDENNIELDYLLNRINSNEALSKIEIENESIPFNEWYRNSDSTDTFSANIKIHVNKSTLDQVLKKEKTSSTYMELFSIAFYVFKIKEFASQITIDENDYKTIYKKANAFLNKYRFYSITERRKLLSTKKTKQEQEELLSTFDKENLETVNAILRYFRIFSDYDIEFANKQLGLILNNMKSDLGFTLRIASLSYDKLEKTSVSNKRKLINEFEELIKKYSDLTDEENAIELY